MARTARGGDGRCFFACARALPAPPEGQVFEKKASGMPDA